MASESSVQKKSKSNAPMKRRIKRAAVACRHCRSKRLKCSSEGRSKSCTNCVLYGASCEYPDAEHLEHFLRIVQTPSTSPSEQERYINQTDKPTGAASIQTTIATTETATLEPLYYENTPDISLERNALHEPFSQETVRNKDLLKLVNSKSRSPPYLDDCGMQLSNYIMANLTGAADELWGLSTTDQEIHLPSEPVVQGLVNIFFKNIATLYPMLDEQKFRLQLQQFYTEKTRCDPLWGFLLNMVLCTACAGQLDYPLNGNNEWQQPCLAQVLSSTILVFSRMSELSAQIFLLTALYYLQIGQPQVSWTWCKWTVRVLSCFCFRENTALQENSPESSVADRVIWCTFILESHVSLAYYKEDSKFQETRVKQPGDRFKREHPVFCFRLAIARLSNRFSRLSADQLITAETFPKKIAALYLDITALKETIPTEWRPDHDIFADPDTHQCVLILHWEYHCLLLAVFKVIAAVPFFGSGQDGFTDSMNCCKDQKIGRVSNSRRILQTLQAINHAGFFNPSLPRWIASTQILAAFQSLYMHVHTQPGSIPARADLSLLLSTAKTVRVVVRNTPFGRSTADLVEHMFHLVSSRVDQAARLLNTSDTTNSSSNLAWNETDIGPTVQAPALELGNNSVTINSNLANSSTSNFGTIFGLGFNFFSEPPTDNYTQDLALPLS